MMKQNKLAVFIFLFSLTINLNSCYQKIMCLSKIKRQLTDSISEKTKNFNSTKLKYQKLIPIFDGLFITYSQLDTASLRKLAINKTIDYNFQLNMEFYQEKVQKWGVIDSLGNTIIPFICDGIKSTSDNEGIISIYNDSYALNTGVPRYLYLGNCYKFNKKGIRSNWKQKFELRIVHNGTHQHEFVISQGNEFYLPYSYRKNRIYAEPSIH